MNINFLRKNNKNKDKEKDYLKEIEALTNRLSTIDKENLQLKEELKKYTNLNLDSCISLILNDKIPNFIQHKIANNIKNIDYVKIKPTMSFEKNNEPIGVYYEVNVFVSRDKNEKFVATIPISYDCNDSGLVNNFSCNKRRGLHNLSLLISKYLEAEIERIVSISFPDDTKVPIYIEEVYLDILNNNNK